MGGRSTVGCNFAEFVFIVCVIVFLSNSIVFYPREMSQAEQVPEDMPAYLKDEPEVTGKFSCKGLLIRRHFCSSPPNPSSMVLKNLFTFMLSSSVTYCKYVQPMLDIVYFDPL